MQVHVSPSSSFVDNLSPNLLDFVEHYLDWIPMKVAYNLYNSLL